jgi:hypothetical protein
MKVLCIDANGVSGLTKGKIYEVIREYKSEGYYRIVNDHGHERKLYAHRFKSLDCNICIERKCNSCELNKET